MQQWHKLGTHNIKEVDKTNIVQIVEQHCYQLHDLHNLCQIWGFHGDDASSRGLLGSDVM
jgi:hypothetical protein